MTIRRLLRGVLLLGDAGYLLAWWLAPATVWAPWVVAAGLLLAAFGIARALRAEADRGGQPWIAFCLPLALPLFAGTARQPPPSRERPRRAGRRVGLTLALTVLLGLSVSGIASERAVDPLLAPIDQSAAIYIDRALIQAGGTYVGARALERLLAVAGDISIGIGFIEGRPGQIFEPLRDLLDRFSTVVLIALASLTLQKVLLELGLDVALPLFLSAATLLALAAVLAGGHRRLAHSLGSAAGLILGTAVVLRLLLPLTGLGVDAIAARVLDDRQAEATATVEQAANRVGLDVDLDQASPSAPPTTADQATLGDRMGKLKDQAQALQSVDQGWLDRLFDALVELVSIFVIETVIAPLIVLLLLWALWRRLSAGMFGPRPP